ncbi:hypothetical protein C0Q70_17948 [Pomacea canaliculata]|uniref:Uncharacterized protein n=1 Tax=Pomacea canaliculata TaxID=400727 RepID=A0A2T7NLU6_POMCA|nr:hypothetical protein C0Q70_17948 [Pomacea canaliculata]
MIRQVAAPFPKRTTLFISLHALFSCSATVLTSVIFIKKVLLFLHPSVYGGVRHPSARLQGAMPGRRSCGFVVERHNPIKGQPLSCPP